MRTALGRRRPLVMIVIVIWAALFHYEALRFPYLQPLLNRSLPDFPILYPGLGWNMFYKMSNEWMGAEYFGMKEGRNPTPIDPHEIFDTKVLGYDPIYLNLPTPSVFDPRLKEPFCQFVTRKFPEFNSIVVSLTGYKPLVPERSQKIYYPNAYECQAPSK